LSAGAVLGLPGGAFHDNPRALCQRLRGLGQVRPTFQRLALFNRQVQRCYRSRSPHQPSSSYKKNGGGLQFSQYTFDSGH